MQWLRKNCLHCILFIIAHNGRKCNKKTDPQRRESVFQFIKTVSQNTLEGVYADDRRIFYSNHMAKIAEQLSNFQPSVCWYFWLFFRQNHIENAVFVFCFDLVSINAGNIEPPLVRTIGAFPTDVVFLGLVNLFLLMNSGQRQRIGLARAMVMEPELVVADEPISALDVSIRAQVLNLLKKFQREKDLTYLFIAHDLSIVRFISDRIAVIYKGDIVEIADAEELFNFPLHPYTHSLISAIPIPDPQLEKNKVLFTYDPSIHDYSTDKPELVCIGHDHWVFGNKKEIEEYKATREKNVPLKTITILDKDAPRPEEHHDNIAHDEIQLPPLHDTGSAWYALLSFLLPVIGIIAAMIFKKHRHYRNYKMCKKGAIAGFIVLAVILALFLLALAAVFI